jgi:alkyl hydroperoxide reductase subunit AhpF
MADDVRESVVDLWRELERPVTVHFHPLAGQPASDAMEELLGELAALSPRLILEKHAGLPAPIPPESPEDLTSSVATLDVDGAPTGIRYLGFPGGHEFGVMVDTVRILSIGQAPAVSDGARAALAGLGQPLHLQVFTTYT